MAATLDDVTKWKSRPEPTAEQRAAEELVARAREQGLSLTGPDGLLKQVTKTVLETALDQEMTGTWGMRGMASRWRTTSAMVPGPRRC
jgi:putative transposase